MALFLIEKSGLENKLIALLEREIATSITEKDCATPRGMLTKPGLATGVAWDNYDETLSGAGTLHDTVGICYQNCVVGDSTVRENTKQVPPINCIKQLKPKTIFEKVEIRLKHNRIKPKIRVFAHVPK